MTKYDSKVTEQLKKYLITFNFSFANKFITFESTERDILKEVFGIDDNLYEVFGVDYIIKKQNTEADRGGNYYNFFIYNINFVSPVASIQYDVLNDIIRIGYAKDYNENGKTPIWYTKKLNENIFSELNDLDLVIKNVVNSQIFNL